jgi:hypothetical protein
MVWDLLDASPGDRLPRLAGAGRQVRRNSSQKSHSQPLINVIMLPPIDPDDH